MEMSVSKFLPFLSLFCLVFFACKDAEKSQHSSSDESTHAINDQEKEQVQNVANFQLEYPNLSQSTSPTKMKEEITKFINTLDENASLLHIKRDQKTLMNSPDTPVKIWYYGEEPIKVTHKVANESGLTEDFFTYYLKDGKPWYIDQIFAHYVFVEGNMVYWLDENWAVNKDIPVDDFQKREAFLQETLDNLLQ